MSTLKRLNNLGEQVCIKTILVLIYLILIVLEKLTATHIDRYISYNIHVEQIF